MGKEEILNYVMNSPENTNPNVLGNMLDSIGSGNAGYECVENRTLIFNGNITTAKEEEENSFADGYFPTSEIISPLPQNMLVKVNGVEYRAEQRWDGDYGAPWDDEAQEYDWSEYPFAIYFSEEVVDGNSFTTSNVNTYAVEIYAVEESVTTSTCFEKAVKSIVGESPLHIPLNDNTIAISELGLNADDVYEMFAQDRTIFIDNYGTPSKLISVNKTTNSCAGTTYYYFAVGAFSGSAYGNYSFVINVYRTADAYVDPTLQTQQ